MVDALEFRIYQFPSFIHALSGHLYTTQANAWMDSRVWRQYLRDVVKPELKGPSAILIGNPETHVSEESSETVSGELYEFLHLLPPNSTSMCQPLDVGVMDPLKKMMRSQWLSEVPVKTASEKRLAMVLRTIKAWDQLSSDTIRSSFAKALPVANA